MIYTTLTPDQREAIYHAWIAALRAKGILPPAQLEAPESAITLEQQKEKP